MKKSPVNQPQTTNKTKKTLVGVVKSDKMQNTAVVQVAVWKVHRVLKKRYQRHNTFMAENPSNTYKIGDVVEMVETAPLSRHKNWLIVRKVDLNTTKGSK